MSEIRSGAVRPLGATFDGRGTNFCVFSDAAERIEATFREPLQLEGVEASLRAAVGVACHPDDGDDLESLMAAADRAMYARKAQ